MVEIWRWMQSDACVRTRARSALWAALGGVMVVVWALATGPGGPREVAFAAPTAGEGPAPATRRASTAPAGRAEPVDILREFRALPRPLVVGYRDVDVMAQIGARTTTKTRPGPGLRTADFVFSEAATAFAARYEPCDLLRAMLVALDDDALAADASVLVFGLTHYGLMVAPAYRAAEYRSTTQPGRLGDKLPALRELARQVVREELRVRWGVDLGAQTQPATRPSVPTMPAGR